MDEPFKRNYNYTYDELLEIIEDYLKYTLDDDMPEKYEYIDSIIYNEDSLTEKEKEELYFKLNNI